MANEDGTLNNADIISRITSLNIPTNGNGQNTAVAPSPHDASKARTLQNKALAIQNLQQAAALKQANEAFSKQVASTVPIIDIPSFVEHKDTSTEDLRSEDLRVPLSSNDLALPKAPTEKDMTTPFTELGEQRADPALVELANQAAIRHDVPQAIFNQLVKQESSWDPRARSNKDAMGLGQLRAGTAADLGLNLDTFGGPGSVWHPESNLNASAKYLRQGFDRYTKQGFSPTESWKISAGAYNAGMGNIKKAMKLVGGDVTSWDQIAAVLPQVTGKDNSTQTINYVNKLTGAITGIDTVDEQRRNIEITKRQEEMVPAKPGALEKLSESITNFSRHLIQTTKKAELNITEFAKSIIKKYPSLGIEYHPNEPDNSERNRKAVEQWVENYGPEFGVSLEYPDTSIDAEKQHELAVQAERLLEFKKKMQDSTLNRPQIVAAGHELAAPSKEPAKSQIGTPGQRATAADLAAQDKANDIARLRALQDTAKFKSTDKTILDKPILDILGSVYNKAGDLAKKVIDTIPADNDVPEPLIDPTPKDSPLFGEQIVRQQFKPPISDSTLPKFERDRTTPSFEDPIPNIFPPARMEDKSTPIKTENKTNGVIEYVDDSFGWRNPETNEVISGLTRPAAVAFSAYMLANQRGRAQWAPTPGSLEEQISKVKRSLGPPLETVFSAFTGPTTLSEVADRYGVSYEDVQKYRAMQGSTSLSTEQQAFAKTTAYKLLTIADEQAKRNQERSDYIREFAETYRKQYPTNDKHIAGATAAFHEVMKAHGGGAKGALAAVINAFKHDKLTFASQGWDSVGYTIAITMGNLPVQLGMFVALAMGTAKLGIQDWKKAHKGKEPPPEVIRDIKILSALRIAVEKASAGLLTKYLSELPLIGGPAAWAGKVHGKILEGIHPSVRSLKTFAGKVVITPAIKTGKAVIAEGGQETLDSIMEEWALIDPATVPEGERWKIDAGKSGLAFVHGGLGVFSTGAGVKVVDLATRTVLKLGDVITSESAAAQYNREYKERLLDPNIARVEDELKRAEDYKNADQKIIKELETVNEELGELLSIDRAGAEIGPNGEVITDSTYIKENFLALSLQIERGELTPQEALERVVSDLEAELSSKMETRDNLSSQVSKPLRYGETTASATDRGTYIKTKASIAALEQETELSEEQETELSEARKEQERLE
ncbi:uncharacterized protein METZ01_LOCUS99311, partial [marine metagenome]